MDPLAHLVDSSLRKLDGHAFDPRTRFGDGRLVRLRRGFYMPTEVWLEASASDRFRAAAIAHALANPNTVFCGETALFLNGIPVVKVPLSIDVAVRSTTRLGLRPNTFDVRGDSDLARRARRVAPPPVRRHRHDDQHTTFTGLATGRFARAITVADGVLRRSGRESLLELPEITSAISRLPHKKHRQRAEVIASLTRAGSESAGESVSRALMHLFGFPEPILQREHRDAQGFVGRTDFAWDVAPEPVGEFDGWGKYFRRELTGGEDPREIIRREKRRENRLLALGHPVLRWDWSELEQPALLRAKLIEGGLRPTARKPGLADKFT
ncbi:hypothetical protein [Sinomonas humi]|uniref:hypothetical protein n=1 Tax=Sinomonas humi TaxID=1338436 RepID=UPI0012DFF712|nr:hypothetical protein [Sinomonas humi]